MKRRILLSAVALVGLSGTAFMACSSTQPQSACVIQTTARGGPGFYAKYTVSGGAVPTGCEFLNRGSENGKAVVGEEIGIALFGQSDDVKLGIEPLALQTSPLGIGSAEVPNSGHIALGKFNLDPSQCTAPTLSEAKAEIPDPGGSSSTVIATYTFKDVKFVQAPNIPGTQWGAKLHYHHESADYSVATCDVDLDVDAVWYASAGTLPDGGPEVSGPNTLAYFPVSDGNPATWATGNSCSSDADCGDALFSLPGGATNFECVPFYLVYDGTNTLSVLGPGLATPDGSGVGVQEIGRDGNPQDPKRCVPRGSVLPGGKGAISE